MKTREVVLTGKDRRELITEIRYETASARVDKSEVLILLIKKDESDNKTSRLVSSVSRILADLKREGLIRFFVSPRAFLENSTEAQFFTNKYEELINNTDQSYVRVYLNP